VNRGGAVAFIGLDSPSMGGSGYRLWRRHCTTWTQPTQALHSRELHGARSGPVEQSQHHHISVALL
jgi:hypothetical protein